MRPALSLLLAFGLATVLQAEDQDKLPAFAIYPAVDAKAPDAKPYSYQSPENKAIKGHFNPNPIAVLKDVHEFQAIHTEYGAAPCPGLGVRFTNAGNGAVARATTKEDKSQFVIVAGHKVVGSIRGSELWRIGTLRLKMLVTLPRDSGVLNETLARSVNEAKKAGAP
jgi:hypothetical protein